MSLGREKKKIFIILLISALIIISQACVQKPTDAIINKYGRIVKITDDYDLILFYESGISNTSGQSLKIPEANLGFSFRENRKDKFLKFSSELYNVTEGTYFFYIPYGGSSVEKYGEDEFDGWNLKIEFRDVGNKTYSTGRTYYTWEIYITYLLFQQDEHEIKNLISSYRDKQLMEFNLSSHMVNMGHTRYYDAEIHSVGDEVFLNESNRPEWVREENYTAANLSLNRNAFLSDVVNVLLNLNYTNHEYGEVERGLMELGLSLEQDITEELILQFDDRTTLKVNYHSYSDLVYGTVEMDGQVFLMAFDAYHLGLPKGRLFYDALMKDVQED